MINFFKNLLRPILISIPKKYISRLGFINYYIYYINGPKERLILLGKYKEQDFANTIFNTRSGIITLEKNVLFSQNVMLLTGKHNFKSLDTEIRRYDVEQVNRDIYIGEGTWLASGCIILGNVKVGKHCVIMSGAVVTKDVPDYCMVGGIPAKIIKILNKEEE
jgi:acetyltransferase-like isoleucine patch superfamily enzyme